MSYHAELTFFKNILWKYHLQTVEYPISAPLPRDLDLGLRTMLNWDADYEQLFCATLCRISPSSIYKIEDVFHCHYVFFLLPFTEEPTVFIIGPYFTYAPDRRRLLEEAEKLGIPPSRFRRLEQCFGNIPVLSEEGFLFNTLNVFGELIWGSAEGFQILDIDQEIASYSAPLKAQEDNSSDEFLLNMRLMEQRYAYEN